MPDLQVLRCFPQDPFVMNLRGQRYFCIFSFFPLAISTRVVYNYLHMAG